MICVIVRWNFNCMTISVNLLNFLLANHCQMQRDGHNLFQDALQKLNVIDLYNSLEQVMTLWPSKFFMISFVTVVLPDPETTGTNNCCVCHYLIPSHHVLRINWMIYFNLYNLKWVTSSI